MIDSLYLCIICSNLQYRSRNCIAFLVLLCMAINLKHLYVNKIVSLGFPLIPLLTPLIIYREPYGSLLDPP